MNLRLKQLLVFITILIAFIGFTYAAIPNNTLQNDWLVVSNINATNSYNIGTNTVIDNNREATFTNLTLSGDLTATGNATINGGFLNEYNLTEKFDFDYSPATFIINKIGLITYAINGTNQDVVFSGTNETTVIRSAYNLTPEGSGIIIRIGDYNITGATGIEVKSNTFIKGEGWGSILTSGANTDLNVLWGNSVSGVTISDLQINGNRANVPIVGSDDEQNNIYFNNSTYCTVKNVYSHNAVFHGIFLVSDSHYNKIIYNRVEDCGYRGIHAHSNCDYNTYSYNLIRNTGLQISQGGLFVIFDGTDYNQVDHNIVINGSAQGIVVFGEDPVGLNQPSTYNKIENNIIYQYTVTRSGIVLRGTLSYLSIKDNTIYAGNHGIVTDASTIMSNSEISGNMIYAAVRGIYWTSGSATKCKITENNIAYTSTGGIYLNSISYSKISDNYIYVQDFNADQYDSINLGGTSIYNEINDNLFFTQTSYGGRYQVNEAHANCNYNDIHDNKWIPVAGLFVNIQGANSTTRNNDGYTELGDIRLNGADVEMYNSTAWVKISP